jgi:hypothetical protein
VPVLIGVTLFNDEVPGGIGRAGFVIALVLVVGGVGLLGADRSRAEPAATGARADNLTAQLRERR